MTVERVRRVFRLLQQPDGELRTMQFEERDHLVVPVVALVEGVIHPVNVTEPELVLASEFAPTVGAWNGEPVTFDHPHIGGTRVTANDPRVLEEFMVGRLFHSRVDGLALRTEAWLDMLRAATMGGLAQELIERVLDGELIEVSVGAFVVAEKVDGVHTDGKRYGAIWREIGPDHLAMLPAGITGACSNAMGCGAGVHASAAVMAVAEAAKVAAFETLGVVPSNVSSSIADADTEWSKLTLSEFTDGSWDDLSDTEKRRIGGHFAWCDASPPSSLGGCKLGHHRSSDGAIVPRGVSAALGRLNQTELPEDDRAAVASHLESHRDAIEQRNASAAPEREGLLHVLTADGLLGSTSTEEGPVSKADTEGGLGKLRARFAEGVRTLGKIFLRDAQGDLSDSDIRQMLDAALFATEPAFVGIEAVFADQGTVVYLVAPEGELMWFERSFEIADDHDVTFGDPIRVAPVTVFEPVAAAAACTCEDPAACECGAQQHEDANMDKQERIAALIANEGTHYTDADKAGLEALSDETLVGIEKDAAPADPEAKPEEKPVATVTPIAPVVPAAPVVPDPAATAKPEEKPAAEPIAATEAEEEQTWLNSAPPRIRAALSREFTREAAQKAAMVEQLTAAQDVYTEEQLGEMNVERLIEVQRLCAGKGVDPVVIEGVDFAGLGMPRASQAKNEEKIDAPPSLHTAVAAKAAAK